MQQFFRNVLLPVVYKQSLRSKSNCTFLLQLFIEMKKKKFVTCIQNEMKIHTCSKKESMAWSRHIFIILYT